MEGDSIERAESLKPEKQCQKAEGEESQIWEPLGLF